MPLNLIHECSCCGIRRFGKQLPRPVERLAHHFLHLSLRVAHEIPAGMIQLRRKFRRHLARFLAQLVRSLLRHFFTQAVQLRLHFLFVPLRRLVNFLARAMPDVSRLAFQF